MLNGADINKISIAFNTFSLFPGWIIQKDIHTQFTACDFNLTTYITNTHYPNCFIFQLEAILFSQKEQRCCYVLLHRRGIAARRCTPCNAMRVAIFSVYMIKANCCRTYKLHIASREIIFAKPGNCPHYQGVFIFDRFTRKLVTG